MPGVVHGACRVTDQDRRGTRRIEQCDEVAGDGTLGRFGEIPQLDGQLVLAGRLAIGEDRCAMRRPRRWRPATPGPAHAPPSSGGRSRPACWHRQRHRRRVVRPSRVRMPRGAPVVLTGGAGRRPPPGPARGGSGYRSSSAVRSTTRSCASTASRIAVAMSVAGDPETSARMS